MYPQSAPAPVEAGHAPEAGPGLRVVESSKPEAQEISQPRHEIHGRLVDLADLEERDVTGWREPQLVHKDQPHYPVYILPNSTAIGGTQARVRSNAPIDLHTIQPDLDQGEFAEWAGLSD